jgi:acetyl-CoA carboxylase carboxyl transferase subunit beta
MKWFNRKDKNIKTPTSQKKELPDGMWYKTPGGSIVHIRELKNNSYVCPEDDYHVRIGSKEYFEILFDNKSFQEYDSDILSEDPLKFVDTKSYKDRVKKTIKATGLNDAIRTAKGKVNGYDLIISCMDFSFIGGSMGSVVGEKISRAIDLSLKRKVPLMIISKSGGARMMESTYSLMQMAKTSAKLSLLDKNKIPYISLLTDPTTGGVSASFAMLGDFNIS